MGKQVDVSEVTRGIDHVLTCSRPLTDAVLVERNDVVGKGDPSVCSASDKALQVTAVAWTVLRGKYLAQATYGKQSGVNSGSVDGFDEAAGAFQFARAILLVRGHR